MRPTFMPSPKETPVERLEYKFASTSIGHQPFSRQNNAAKRTGHNSYYQNTSPPKEQETSKTVALYVSTVTIYLAIDPSLPIPSNPNHSLQMKSFSTQVPLPCAMGSSVYKSISWNRFPDFNFLGLLIRRLLVKILLTRKLGIRAKRVKMDTAPSQTQSFGQTEINWDKYVFLFPNLLIYMRFYVFLCSLWGNLLVVFPMFLRNSLHFNHSFCWRFSCSLSFFHYELASFRFLVMLFFDAYHHGVLISMLTWPNTNRSSIYCCILVVFFFFFAG